MEAIEFEAELSGGTALVIPAEVASRLPKSGRARIIVLTANDSDDGQWTKGAYEQFLRDDAPEDAIYDALK